MKRFTIIVALVLLAAMPVFAERITPETARKVATTFLNNNGAKTTQLTDLSKAAGFPNLYIFSTENSFVVMAADDCVKPILGYSLTNTFIAEEMPENISSWLLGYSDEIQWAIDNKQRATSEIAQQWKDLVVGKTDTAKADAVVGPLIQTKWNQRSPYNDLCPSGTVTGCVATAMAQVMKFWEHPTMGTDSHSYTWNNQTLSADFGATTYDWDNMTNTYNSSSNETQKLAVATLMYHCGVSVEMKYNTSSSAKTYDVMSALQTYFSYAPCMRYKSKNGYSHEVWITMLKRELYDGRPLQYRGSDAGGNGGHSFVCDGYDSDDNFHFNWGWGSYCDGYYSISNMNPNPDASATGAGNGVYTVGQSAIFGIEPISSLLAPNLSASVDQNVITLTWNNVDDAVSYDVYRDNIKIATSITDNSYIDSNVISGTYYEYYVRAVSGETRSNPSNFVTKLAFFRDYTPATLTATLTSSNAMLTWTKPQNNATLQYATDYSGSRYGMGEGEDTYWREVFAPSRLCDFIGMYIEKVSAYLELSGSYTLFIYQAEPNTDDELAELLYEKTFLVSSAGWMDIELESPIQLDCNKELWIMMYYPYIVGSTESYWYPATYGAYNEIQYDNEEDEERENPRLIGELVEGSIKWYHVGANISWLFRTFISDGTYTYNIYDGETKLNDEAIAGTTYIHESPEANTIHNYTVKTNYYGGESAASNTASLALGSNTLTSLTLENKDNLTIGSGSILTVTGSLSNADEDNLVLENGAQLIHNSDGVAATVKKDIAAWTTEPYVGGWNFIASPISETFTPTEENGLLSGNYDLYFYDEPFHTWRNHKEHLVDGINQNAASNFNIEYKKGYLYANDTYTTLQFAGTLMPSNNSITINDLSHSATELNGFNLVGNPFACNATIDKDCYIIDGESITLAEESPTLAPCEGVMVKADPDQFAVTFTKASGAKGNGKSLNLVVTQGKTTLDRARVRLGEGTNMEKFTLDNEHTQISFWNNGHDFAVVCTNGLNELPLNFKAAENGTYSIGIETNSLNLDYLHLIDNLTGDDIDLLTTPSYSFEAKTTDYASRFRLVFNADDASTSSAADATFAYVSNGKIVITSDALRASLQVVDMMGRVVLCTDVARNVSTQAMPAGVYVLRLIDGENVRTQKIVIE